MPKFKLEGHDGNVYTDKDFLNKCTVIYFYPKDDTPGCTKEACSINDSYDELLNMNVNLVGISCDNLESHKAFSDKYNLKFPLLSDVDKIVSTEFGAWGEKNLYGKKYVGMKRYTYVFDKNGIVVKIYKRVKTETHGADLVEFIKKNSL